MTPGQMKVYQYIKSHIAEHGYSPSYQVIADAMGFKSRSQAYQYVVKLVEHGLLRKNGKAGGIQLVEDDRDLLIVDLVRELDEALLFVWADDRTASSAIDRMGTVLDRGKKHIRSRALTELARADAPHINGGK